MGPWLFDAGEYGRGQKRPAHHDAQAEALALDRKTKLVMADDGALARVVALHSLDKAYFARYFADIVGKAMNTAYPGPLAWVELFAGPGRLRVKDLEQFHPGSPVEAIEGIKQRFDRYVFADLHEPCFDALKRRVGDHAAVPVLRGDANSPRLHDEILALVPRNSLLVLTPTRPDWICTSTRVKFFADRYRYLDLLLNFPVPGIDRAPSAGEAGKASKVLNEVEPIKLLTAPKRPNLNPRVVPASARRSRLRPVLHATDPAAFEQRRVV